MSRTSNRRAAPRYFDRWVTVLAPGTQLRNLFDSYGVNINNASIALKVDYPMARILERGRTAPAEARARRRSSSAPTRRRARGGRCWWTPSARRPRTAVTDALRGRAAAAADAQVFKVPHHGSKHGLNLELVEAIEPAVSIVSSVREGGRYHFPHEVMQAALREALDPRSSEPGKPHRKPIASSTSSTRARSARRRGRACQPTRHRRHAASAPAGGGRSYASERATRRIGTARAGPQAAAGALARRRRARRAPGATTSRSVACGPSAVIASSRKPVARWAICSTSQIVDVSGDESRLRHRMVSEARDGARRRDRESSSGAGGVNAVGDRVRHAEERGRAGPGWRAARARAAASR